MLQVLFNSAEGLSTCSADNVTFELMRFLLDEAIAVLAFDILLANYAMFYLFRGVIYLHPVFHDVGIPQSIVKLCSFPGTKYSAHYKLTIQIW